MKTRWSPALFLHVALWSGLIGGLLCTTPTELLRRTRLGSYRPIESQYSSDHYLTAVTEVVHPSQYLERVISTLPQRGRIVVLVHYGELASGYIGMATAYVAWPHQVQMIECTDDTAEKELSAVRPADVSALIFCKIKPPAWCSPEISIGPNIQIVRLKNVALAQ